MRQTKHQQDNLHFYIHNIVAFTIMTNLFKPFMVTYLKTLGGGELHITLLNSLPGLVAIFTIIPGSLILNTVGNKQKATALFTLFSRSILLFFALVPFAPLVLQPFLFAILVGIRNFPESLSIAGNQSFTAEAFVAKERTNAITTSRSYSMLIQIAVASTTGVILNFLPQTPSEKLLTYQVFFGLAFVVGGYEVYQFMKMKPVVQNREEKRQLTFTSFKEVFADIFRIKTHKKYWGFLLCSLIFHFGWQMGWPLFSIKQVEYLGAGELWIAAFFGASSLMSFFTYRMWNKWINRYGADKVAFIVTFGMSLNALCVAISPNLPVMMALSTVSGIFTSGTVTVLLNILLEVTPDRDRIIYVGVYNTILNISLFISPFIGHWVLTQTSIFTALLVVVMFRVVGGTAFLLRYKHIQKQETKKVNITA